MLKKQLEASWLLRVKCEKRNEEEVKKEVLSKKEPKGLENSQPVYIEKKKGGRERKASMFRKEHQ